MNRSNAQPLILVGFQLIASSAMVVSLFTIWSNIQPGEEEFSFFDKAGEKKALCCCCRIEVRTQFSVQVISATWLKTGDTVVIYIFFFGQKCKKSQDLTQL